MSRSVHEQEPGSYIALFVLKVEMRNLNKEVERRNEQIVSLEKQIADTIMASQKKPDHDNTQVIFAFIASFLACS